MLTLFSYLNIIQSNHKHCMLSQKEKENKHLRFPVLSMEDEVRGEHFATAHTCYYIPGNISCAWIIQ